MVKELIIRNKDDWSLMESIAYSEGECRFKLDPVVGNFGDIAICVYLASPEIHSVG